MSGESISTLILFIAAMLVAASVAGTLVTSVGELSGSIDGYSGDVSDDIETDVEIISDPGSDAIVGDNNQTVTLLVKNTGDRTLPSDGTELDPLVDGRYVSNENLSVTVLEEPTWNAGTVAQVTLSLSEPLDAGEHRVMLSVRGSESTFQFYYGGA
ncbi:flagellin [Halovivax asiaticus JCM 14624]|uniref:Flagellin n=1 Tax=Halovivax asiaticus JCM 14624 TaxID=1227490 RepID=M0BM97_9EURY|nr:flagellin [Halovivax asiaticus]ELZ11985.1 flagellin [Halovivax asiaticus JCM 14624]